MTDDKQRQNHDIKFLVLYAYKEYNDIRNVLSFQSFPNLGQ